MPPCLCGKNGEAYNPTRFRLTLEDGTVYIFDKYVGLLSITDPYGHAISYSDDAITHSSGASLSIERDTSNRIEYIRDQLGRTVEYQYDEDGMLVKVIQHGEGPYPMRVLEEFGYQQGIFERPILKDIIAPDGTRLGTFEYDSSGRKTALIDHNGNRVLFGYDTPSHEYTVTDRRGNPTSYTYDSDGNVTSITDAEGSTETYTYDADGNVLAKTNKLGYTNSFTYDADGNVLTETDPLGNTMTYTYDSQGNRLTETDPLEHTTTFTYDAYNKMLTQTDALGQMTSFTYDADGLKIAEEDALGNITRFTYDGQGNLASKTDPLGNTKDYAYNGYGNVTTIQDMQGTLADLVYNPNGDPVQVTEPLGTVVKFEYDVNGNLTNSIDQLGYMMQYIYDSNGNVTTKIDQEGNVTSYTYDENDQPVAEITTRTTPTGIETMTTISTFDTLGRLIQRTDAAGNLSHIEFNPIGSPTATVDKLGNRRALTYDPAGRNTAITDALGNTMTFEYSTRGQLMKVIDPNNRVVQFEYDLNGRKTRTIFPDSTFIAYGYDDKGRLISETDQAGKTMQYEYDNVGRLTKVIDVLGHETMYAYDEVGNLIAQTDANGNTTSFEYDHRGRMTKRTLPLGMSETMNYDEDGNLIAKTDFNGKTITFVYNSLNQLVKKTYPDGTFVEYVYTEEGLPKTITTIQGTTSYDYDSRYRLLSKTNPDGSSMAYTYDDAGNRTSVTTPSGAVSYTFDELNRTAMVTDPGTDTTNYTYDDVGNLKTVTYPNGTKAEYTYDDLNRLTNLVNSTSDGTIISSYTYTLDDAGNRTKVVEHSGRTVEYEYDEMYKLVKETITDPGAGTTVITYTYDAVGNRLSKTENGVTTNYTYDDNDRLIQEGDITYSYDSNGNLIGENSTEEQITYSYDYENRLIRVETTKFGTTIVVEYDYDAQGNRIRKTIDGLVTTTYLVDENRDYAQVLEERDGSGNLLVRYVYGHDLISQTRGGSTTYYHYDGLGSTRALTNSAEVVTDTYNYDAFGNLLDKTGSTVNNHLFTGEFFDANIGFYYLRARYMNPATGRFITIDPFDGQIRDPYSLHKYLYANANPVIYIDSSGYRTMTLKELLVGSAIINIMAAAAIKTLPVVIGLTGGLILGNVAVGVQDRIEENLQEAAKEAVAALELVDAIKKRKLRYGFYRGLSHHDVYDWNHYGLILCPALRIRDWEIFSIESLNQRLEWIIGGARAAIRAIWSGNLAPIIDNMKNWMQEYLEEERGEPSGTVTVTGTLWIAAKYAILEYGTNKIADIQTKRAVPLLGIYRDDKITGLNLRRSEAEKILPGHNEWYIPLVVTNQEILFVDSNPDPGLLQ